MQAIQVAVDAHAVGRRQTGNEVYIRSLIERYPLLAPEMRFLAYYSAAEAEPWIPASFERRRVAANPFLRLGWDLGRRLRQDRPNLLHVQYTAPLRCPTPVVVTIHDVSYLERPNFLPAWRAMQLRLSVARTVKRAAKILTVSEFSRQRIASSYGIDPAAIAVTPEAAQECFRPMNRDRARRLVRDRLDLHRPFLLHVGDLRPRKNQIGLIRAFGELLEAHPQLPHALVIAGKHTTFAARVLQEARRSKAAERIVFTKFVDDAFLPTLYNAADLFVFPSFYEGFGLPVIEAMACGRPVICSTAAALPEVVDGAALLFDPSSVGEQLRAMRDILLDGELAARMEKKSLQRAKAFDWRETARRTLDAYAEAVEVGRIVSRKELAVR